MILQCQLISVKYLDEALSSPFHLYNWKFEDDDVFMDFHTMQTDRQMSPLPRNMLSQSSALPAFQINILSPGLKMEMECFSEMMTSTHETTCHQNPEEQQEHHHRHHRHDNLKSHMEMLYFFASSSSS
jgi:hypothetical protein